MIQSSERRLEPRTLMFAGLLCAVAGGMVVVLGDFWGSNAIADFGLVVAVPSLVVMAIGGFLGKHPKRNRPPLAEPTSIPGEQPVLEKADTTKRLPSTPAAITFPPVLPRRRPPGCAVIDRSFAVLCPTELLEMPIVKPRQILEEFAMSSGKGPGRVVGVILLLQMATALITPFVLMDALVKGYPHFLETAADSAVRIRFGVTVAFLGLGLTLALGVWIYPVLTQYSKRAALWFLGICIVSAVLDAVHNGTVLSMLSAAERFAESGGMDGNLYQAWGAVSASTRRSAHVVQLAAIGGWMATFYILLFRFRLVQRPLAALGLLGVASQFTGVTLMMFIGIPVIGYMAMPLAPIHAATAIWLIVKGFPHLPPVTPTDSRSVH